MAAALVANMATARSCVTIQPVSDAQHAPGRGFAGTGTAIRLHATILFGIMDQMPSNPVSRTPSQPISILKSRKQKRVMLVGGGAREHAIGKALCRTGRVELYVFAHNTNPGLANLAPDRYKLGAETDVPAMVDWARANQIDFVVIGLEDPLSVGLPDALARINIPTVGPVQAAAQLETSKLFLRELMRDHQLRGSVTFEYFTDAEAFEAFLRNSSQQFALKPVGLTAGKGVQVMGVQLQTLDEAIAYGRKVIAERVGGVAGILLEERLEGPEFTLQAFVDGSTVRPMPLVKDYKLAYERDTGPNTGSMGSYSRADGLLGFVSQGEYSEAKEILQEIVQTLRMKGVAYRGIMYGQFMKTRDGIKLIEINARFGDPEAINVLSLLKTDFVDVCEAIVSDSLANLPIRFEKAATVCKYVTPEGYPTAPVIDEPLSIDLEEAEDLDVKVFFAKVERSGDSYLTTSSRSIALLGIAPTVEEAHVKVEEVLRLHISGRHHVRHDIGTRRLTEEAVAAWTVPEPSVNAATG